ncbi:Universal stress protein family [Acidisarcina polymorpha]|uniref:Universal stress protein family n=1 Tax=Acidisarcina polymorpha TaxID=2211140 RepID=A0A2Z5G727_9BACT|nr:universal stress protein [Acidisarcina polymorpha]AXC14475.1 Universal stress protein family [Acidisarcina polymorpha]
MKNSSELATLAAMANPSRILVATDLTDCDFLVPHVVGQALANHAHVTLIHAIVPLNSFPLEAGATPYPERDSIDREAQTILLHMAHQIRAHGISCDVEVKHGFASDVIREELSRIGATRLIMGTHGRGKWGQFALGSVAKELLKMVDVPIFTIGPHALTPSVQANPHRILHPVSLVGQDNRSIAISTELARTYHAELTLLHVMSPDVGRAHNSERTLTWARHALEALIPKGAELTPPVQTIATCGSLVDEILTTAATSKADWIVLGVDGDYPFWSFKDATAYKVLASATCPVLTIRHVSRAVATETIADEATHAPAATVLA